MQPSFKYRNYTDDMYLVRSSNFIPDFSRFFPVFGNYHLDDVSVEKVFELIVSALSTYDTRYEKMIGH